MARTDTSFVNGKPNRLGIYAGFTIFGVISLVFTVVFFDFLLTSSINTQVRYFELAQRAKDIRFEIDQLQPADHKSSQNLRERAELKSFSRRAKITSELEAMGVVAKNSGLKKQIFNLQTDVSERSPLRGVKSNYFNGRQQLQLQLEVIARIIDRFLTNEAVWLGKIQMTYRLAMMVAVFVILFGAINLVIAVNFRLLRPLKNITEILRAIVAGNMAVRVPKIESDHLLADVFNLVKLFKRNSIISTQAQNIAALKIKHLEMMGSELRRPVNAILHIGDHLLKTELAPKTKSDIQAMCTNARSMSTISANIVDYSALQTGAVELERNLINPGELLNNVTRGFVKSAADKGIDLCFSILGKQPPSVYGDATKLQQVLSNLIGVALRHALKGRVVITVSHVMTDHSEIELRCSVENSLGTLPRDIQENLYASLNIESSSAQSIQTLDQMSLPVACQLVQLMGGDIGCDQSADTGCKFWFSIRCQISSADHGDPLDASAAGKRLRILVAEGDKDHARHVVKTLALAGHYADVTRTSYETVEAVLDAPYDVILLDDHIPGRGGPETAQQIRNLTGGAATIPMIALTAFTGAVDREMYMAAGMDDHLVKPIHPKHLFNALWTAIDNRQITAEAAQKAEQHSDVDTVKTAPLAKPHPISRFKLGGALKKKPRTIVLKAGGSRDQGDVLKMPPVEKPQIVVEISEVKKPPEEIEVKLPDQQDQNSALDMLLGEENRLVIESAVVKNLPEDSEEKLPDQQDQNSALDMLLGEENRLVIESAVVKNLPEDSEEKLPDLQNQNIASERPPVEETQPEVKVTAKEKLPGSLGLISSPALQTSIRAEMDKFMADFKVSMESDDDATLQALTDKYKISIEEPEDEQAEVAPQTKPTTASPQDKAEEPGKFSLEVEARNTLSTVREYDQNWVEETS